MQHGGEGKRDGLSTSGLSDGDDITTAESHRPGLTLDRSWASKALSADGSHDIVGEANFVKGSDGAGNTTSLDL